MVYHVIALALYMGVGYSEVLRCPLEELRWLLGPEVELPVAGKSGISQLCSCLGLEPLKLLYEWVVMPITVKRTSGAW